jgi:DNA-directed RNA polymerase specialized sigma24 family protein
MAPALLSAIRCRLRRQAQAYRRHLEASTDLADVADSRSPGTTVLEDLARALERLAGGEISRSDAAVIYAHRVLGYSISELAGLTGHTRKQLDYWRLRGERVLSA